MRRIKPRFLASCLMDLWELRGLCSAFHGEIHNRNRRFFIISKAYNLAHNPRSHLSNFAKIMRKYVVNRCYLFLYY